MHEIQIWQHRWVQVGCGDVNICEALDLSEVLWYNKNGLNKATAKEDAYEYTTHEICSRGGKTRFT